MSISVNASEFCLWSGEYECSSAREFAAASSVQHVLRRDYETRGVLQLQKVGPWKYAADNYTEVLCCAFCEQQFYSLNCPPRAGAMSEPMPTCNP
jgi:hypothetical protein